MTLSTSLVSTLRRCLSSLVWSFWYDCAHCIQNVCWSLISSIISGPLWRFSFSALQLNTNRCIHGMTLIAFIKGNFSRSSSNLSFKSMAALNISFTALASHSLSGVGAVTMSGGHCSRSTSQSGPFRQH